MRAIRASAMHPFAPAMRFIANVIRARMRNFQHFLKDSDDFTRKMLMWLSKDITSLL